MAAPYVVEIDGFPVQCETAEAALDLIRAHGGKSAAPASRGHRTHEAPAGGSRWTDQRVAEFFKLIEGRQRKLIDTLLAADDGRTDDQLLQIVGVDSGMGLAGVFAGLYKNAKKVGADPRELYVKKPIHIGDKRGNEYSLHEGFRLAAKRRLSK